MVSTENRQAWFAKRRQTLIWLMEQFPLAFSNGIKPLKVGIHQDIFESNAGGVAANLRNFRTVFSHSRTL
jgi:sRNA-binding protein